MSKKVTLVTGLWDIKRDELQGGWSRNYEYYLEKFSHLLEIPNNLIIFGDEELKKFVFERRDGINTQFIVRSQEWFKGEFYNPILKIRTDEKWINQTGWICNAPHAKLDLYNPLVMSKPYILHDAKIMDKFNSTHLFWLDAGITNTVHAGYLTHDRVLDKMSNIDKFSFVAFPYETNSEIHGFEYGKLNELATGKVNKVCRGGLFGGPVEAIDDFNTQYYNLMKSTLNEGYMGTEESLFTILLYRYPENYQYYLIESNGLINKFFEDVKNDNHVALSESKNIKIKVMDKLPISIGILSWNSPQTLTDTLTTYFDREFLHNVTDVCILFNEVSGEDIKVANHFNIPYLPYKENIGIGKAFKELTKQAKTDNVLILENDWQLIEDLPTTLNRLQSGLDLLNGGYDVIKYRHRTNPGYPLFTSQYKGKELDYYDDWSDFKSPHLLDAIHWTDKPEKKFEGKIGKSGEYFTTTSRWGNWTNNPCLYKKDFYLNTIEPYMGEGIDLERKIAYWWPRQSFKIAQGEGLFTHKDTYKWGNQKGSYLD